MKRVLRLGTRGSTLAGRQSTLVADALRVIGVEVQLVTIVTSGDVRQPDTAWGEGAFVGGLETALLGGEIDLAVHSAKDLPIAPEEELVIAAYTERADARDALVGRVAGCSGDLAALAAGSVIGTDSPRRTGFVLAERPDVEVRPLHGNVDSRLARLDRGEVNALVLAVAGLARLGRRDRIDAVFPPDVVPPAPGQGALAVQVRAADRELHALLAGIDHLPTRIAVSTEREVLRRSGGGCRAPLGAFATLAGGDLHLVAGVVDPSGAGRRIVARTGAAADALDLAAEVAAELLPDRRWPAGFAPRAAVEARP